MKQSDYLEHDAVGLARLIARREVSAAEVLEAAVGRLEAVNPAINAVIYTDLAAARAEAGQARAGPLAGVPFLVKDYAAHVGGWPTSAGSRLYQHEVAAADAPIVSAYRRAGLVIFGKTNLPELGLDATTEPDLHGPTRNPWDVARTAGGSSGGSAAAVAAGFDAQHAITRSVRDSAALLDAVCSPELGDPYSAPPRQRPFLEECARDPGRLRVGFTTEAFEAGALSPECLAAVAQTASLLASLGHQVEEIALPAGLDGAVAASGAVLAGHIAADLDARAEQLGRPIAEADVEPLTFARYQHAQGYSASDYVRSLRVVHAYGRAMAQLLDRYDVVLASTLGSPPVPLGVLRGAAPGAAGVARRAFMPNTRIFNLTGQPAMSVPLAWTDDGLPVGVQFVAAMGGEAILFRLAAQLEAAAPWAGRRPSLGRAAAPAA